MADIFDDMGGGTPSSCWQESNDSTDHSPILLVAAVALIDRDGRILISKRPPNKPMANLWEFPGGKIEQYESPETALIRELKEELSIDTKQSCLSPLAFASHRYDTFHLLMPLFACRQWQGNIQACEGQALKWVFTHDLSKYPMPAADIPLIPLIRDILGG